MRPRRPIERVLHGGHAWSVTRSTPPQSTRGRYFDGVLRVERADASRERSALTREHHFVGLARGHVEKIIRSDEPARVDRDGVRRFLRAYGEAPRGRVDPLGARLETEIARAFVAEAARKMERAAEHVAVRGDERRDGRVVRGRAEAIRVRHVGEATDDL